MIATVLINIDVDDLERAVAFYTAGFGLKIGRRLGPSSAGAMTRLRQDERETERRRTWIG